MVGFSRTTSFQRRQAIENIPFNSCHFLCHLNCRIWSKKVTPLMWGNQGTCLFISLIINSFLSFQSSSRIFTGQVLALFDLFFVYFKYIISPQILQEPASLSINWTVRFSYSVYFSCLHYKRFKQLYVLLDCNLAWS